MLGGYENDGYGGSHGEGSAVFVSNLQWWTTDVELEALCAAYGHVVSIRFLDDKACGKSRGMAIVEFAGSDAATACIAGLAGREVNGRACRVSHQQQRHQGGASTSGQYGGGGRGAGSGLAGSSGGRGLAGRGGRGGMAGRGSSNSGGRGGGGGMDDGGGGADIMMGGGGMMGPGGMLMMPGMMGMGMPAGMSVEMMQSMMMGMPGMGMPFPMAGMPAGFKPPPPPGGPPKKE
ncbi:Zinc finger CCHC-type and RNA-binding motif-containing protein 1 [Chlorella vulgaris]